MHCVLLVSSQSHVYLEETVQISEVLLVARVHPIEEDTDVNMKYYVTMPVAVLMVKHVLKHWLTSMALYVTQRYPVKH